MHKPYADAIIENAMLEHTVQAMQLINPIHPIGNSLKKQKTIVLKYNA